MNVFHDGAHEIAERVVMKVRGSRKPHFLWVMPGGAYRIEYRDKKWRRGEAPPDDCIVGLYTNGSTMKQVRADIEQRVKELRA